MCIQSLIENFSAYCVRKCILFSSVQFSCSVVYDSLPTPWTAACQASLSITNFQSLLKLMSIELVMPSNHVILCCPLLPLPLFFPSIRVFSNESVLLSPSEKNECFLLNLREFIFQWRRHTAKCQILCYNKDVGA